MIAGAHRTVINGPYTKWSTPMSGEAWSISSEGRPWKEQSALRITTSVQPSSRPVLMNSPVKRSMYNYIKRWQETSQQSQAAAVKKRKAIHIWWLFFLTTRAGCFYRNTHETKGEHNMWFMSRWWSSSAIGDSKVNVSRWACCLDQASFSHAYKDWQTHICYLTLLIMLEVNARQGGS